MVFLFLLFVCVVSHAAGNMDPILGMDPSASPQQSVDLTFGDMMLTDKQKKALKSGEDMGGSSNAFAAVTGNNLRWTNAVIPYEIDCSIENLADAVDSVMKAMAEWEAKTCIRFVKRTNEKYYLRFFRNTHCWGNVGMTSYTRISVGHGCEYQHVMTHEIGHVVGFYHEQNRKDRDKWIKVHWENIGQFKDAFDIVKNTDSLGVAYDYASIMHYPWNAFSSNGKNTISPTQDLKGKTPYIELSKDDAEQTSRMYNCPNIMKKRQQARNKRHVGHIEDKRATKVDCADRNRYCSDWARDGHCSISTYVQEHCKLSCKSPSCQGSDCLDQRSECPKWKSWGHCSLNPTVATLCQKSCNPTCHGTVPTQTPTASPPSSNPPVMTNPPTRGPVPTGKPNGKFLGTGKLCQDKHQECANWAKNGECQANPGWMLRNCMVSCNNTVCDQPGLKPPGQCADPLGLSSDGTKNFKIPDSAFSSPYHLSPGGGWDAAAKNARLYFEDDYDDKRIGSWCAKSHDSARSADGYVQVDLGSRKTISYIATQGRDKYFERVAKFKIQYGDNGSTFQTYQEGGSDKVFDGNCDHVTPVLNKFTNRITARYIRYIPTDWNYPCVRMEFYGC
ncbi:zinc metalloproteinase nas-14-like [Hydractinia symbiolongicarpus]|uniref:zinc metalloproteinase nas-14-like n=1 Tax=Hydractinia symbiolongicarpus TaxID=13093 RepID=UPI00255139EB|nr:zinc metalloproteinase nas-14-like [Hydractinia symbiolongicarpus]XP_057302424.1 zinc metalloproteinase nas-14-like [Hydractinia symbiolongicarpus]